MCINIKLVHTRVCQHVYKEEHKNNDTIQRSDRELTPWYELFYEKWLQKPNITSIKLVILKMDGVLPKETWI